MGPSSLDVSDAVKLLLCMEASLRLSTLVLQVIAAEDKSNEEIDLGGKSHFTFGRLEDTCDICLVGG